MCKFQHSQSKYYIFSISIYDDGDGDDNYDDGDDDGDDDDDDNDELVIIWGRWGTLKWGDGNFRWKL